MKLYSTVKIFSYHQVDDYSVFISKFLAAQIDQVKVPTTLLNPDNILSQLIAGSLLGDAYLASNKHGTNASFAFHCAWNDNNLAMVMPVLLACKQANLATGKFAKRQVIEVHQIDQKIVEKTFYRIRVGTKHSPLFYELYSVWYPNGKKVLPANIAHFLTPISLAFWFMGDGGRLGDSAVSLNTQGFTIEQQQLLQDILYDKFGLKCALNKDKQYYRIVFDLASSVKLYQILRPILHPSCVYKFNHLLTK